MAKPSRKDRRIGSLSNRSEQAKVGLRSAAVLEYGEHRRPEIGLRSRLLRPPYDNLKLIGMFTQPSIGFEPRFAGSNAQAVTALIAA